MYRKFSLLFMVLLLMTLFLGSCVEKTDKFIKKNTTKKVVDAKQVQIDSLQSVLIDVQRKVRTINARAEQVVAQCDSMNIENQALQVENSKLKIQLAQVRNEVIPAMLQSYEESYEAQRCALEEKDEKITSLNNDLWNVNNLNNALINDRDALQMDLNNMMQWTKKYQHDSERSFIKVMFGAGKAPIPDVPTPQLE